MKFRSFVLWSCMLVVPLLAMFSHRIPAEAREAFRTHLWQPAIAGVAGVVGRVIGTTPSQPATTGTVAPEATAPAATVTVQSQPAAAGGPPPEPPQTSTPSTQPQRAASAPAPLSAAPLASASPPTPPLAPPPHDGPTPTTTDTTSDRRRSIETSLARLGAVAIRCEPLPGHEGMHVGSCHVAIDASGQLQRVFQAAGTDPDMALEHLLDEVLSWRGRAVIRQAEDTPATGNGGAIRL